MKVGALGKFLYYLVIPELSPKGGLVISGFGGWSEKYSGQRTAHTKVLRWEGASMVNPRM